MIPGIMMRQTFPPPAPGASDPDFASVALLCHFDGSGSTFIDEKGNTLTASTASHSTTEKLFGTASLYASSSANAQITTASLSTLLVSGQFTIEFAVYLTTATLQYFLVTRGSATLSINTSSGKIQAVIFGTTITDPSTYALNAWTRVRLTRDASNICRLFVNGVLVATSGAVSTNQTGTSVWEFGGSYFWAGGTGGLRDGYMDEFRVTLGVCRSTANYTLDTARFPDS